MPGGDIAEFKYMVQRLHEAGIEVILDVVYNHTAEGNQLGPTLCFRGLDNANYYVLADDRRYYYDTTGCGNNVNLRHPRVVQMVMDSLRYWVEECHVDGFRFDLAVTLTRDRDAVDFNSPFLDAVSQDPVLAQVKMISESWDVGPNGYQVGGFPPGWAEWNGRFRDDMRAYVKGDDSTLPGFARNLLGSGDIFDRRGRRPWASVNFITAHDGFTLADLYAYNEKHNEANGEGNRDGHDDNRSWNCGVEGPTDDAGGAGAARPDAALRDGDAGREPGSADDPDGRRERPHPAGQQQRLLPGQRARLDELEPRRRARRRSSTSSPGRCGSGASCRCSRRALAARRPGGPRAGCRGCAGCARTARRWARRNGATACSGAVRWRSPPRRRGRAAPVQRRARGRDVRAAADRLGRPWRLRLDSASGQIRRRARPGRPARPSRSRSAACGSTPPDRETAPGLG